MKAVIARCDDWQALYFDGEVAYQNHSITAAEALELLSDQGVIEFEHIWVDQNWAESEGYLPEELNAIPAEVREDE